MFKKFLCFFVLLFFVLSSRTLMATSIEMFGALTVPMGDFGDDSGSDAGMATLGYGMGIDILFPIPESPLSWSLSSIFTCNSTDEAKIEDYLGGTVDSGSWISIPFLTGLRGGGELSPNTEMYVFGQAGLAILRAPDLEVYGYLFDGYEYYEFRGKQNFNSTTSFAFCIGGGCCINDIFNISIRYLSLGKPEIDGDAEVWLDGEYLKESFEAEQSVSNFLISIGIVF